MKVRDIIVILSNYSLDDEVAIKWFDKEEFEVNLEIGLSDNNWTVVCETFEQDENIDNILRDTLTEESEKYDGEDVACYTCSKENCTCDEDTDALKEMFA